MSNGDLHKYFLNNPGKRIHKLLHYFDIYERHLARFRNQSVTMLEIGVHSGGSLQMWKNYLGKDSKIIGIDINPACKAHEEDGVEIFIGSQDNQELINEIIKKYQTIDIILDDGSHMMHHMIASLEMLYPYVSENGIYIVEDRCCCYWEQFDGGLYKKTSFIEYAKNLIDSIQASANLHLGGNTKTCIPINQFMRSTDFIAFYDSAVVFEKRKQGFRSDLITQSM